jgi:hypothetical protein
MSNPTTKIRFPVFRDYEVRVILANDIVRTGQRIGSEDLSNTAGAYVVKPEQPHVGYLILGPDPDEELIAHEASHAVKHMFKVSGARMDDEAFAHHIGYLVGRIHKFLLRHIDAE